VIQFFRCGALASEYCCSSSLTAYVVRTVSTRGWSSSNIIPPLSILDFTHKLGGLATLNRTKLASMAIIRSTTKSYHSIQEGGIIKEGWRHIRSDHLPPSTSPNGPITLAARSQREQSLPVQRTPMGLVLCPRYPPWLRAFYWFWPRVQTPGWAG
jgi:hypothetical protein